MRRCWQVAPALQRGDAQASAMELMPRGAGHSTATGLLQAPYGSLERRNADSFPCNDFPSHATFDRPCRHTNTPPSLPIDPYNPACRFFPWPKQYRRFAFCDDRPACLNVYTTACCSLTSWRARTASLAHHFPNARHLPRSPVCCTPPPAPQLYPRASFLSGPTPSALLQPVVFHPVVFTRHHPCLRLLPAPRLCFCTCRKFSLLTDGLDGCRRASCAWFSLVSLQPCSLPAPHCAGLSCTTLPCISFL